ncbi:MAG TPA: S1C family serine protease [Thermomicrobiales bacterium]|nr:S1C family serine protease [Thermomicrobiales bacterium]
MDQLSPAQVGNVFADAVEYVSPGVVAVHGRAQLPATGTVWKASESEAVIVTASHVIDREESLFIRLSDGTDVPATLLGRDFTRDMAVLRVESGGIAPVTPRLENTPRIGTLVMAVGKPLASEPQASLGSVVFVGSIRLRSYRTGCFIHADPTLYPGFSGGPLIDATGAVLGINSSGIRQAGSFTVPADQVDRIVQDIVEIGHVRTAWIGITVKRGEMPESAQKSFTEQLGAVIISGIEPGSPAARVGLHAGDILISVDEQPLEDVTDLKHILCNEHIGDPLKIVAWRNDTRIDVTVTPVARPEQPCG